MDKRYQLVSEILEQCKAQKELWQQVPFLTLQAQGLSGWDDGYQACIYHGMWRLPYSTGGMIPYSVDCATGVIHRFSKPADQYEVGLLMIDPSGFDAKRVIAQLKAEVTKEKQIHDHSIHFNKYPFDWRDKLAKELKLEEAYKREKPIPPPTFNYP